MNLRERLNRLEAIVIGGSAGAIKALLRILPALPENYPLAVVVVVHMPELFESRLPHIFSQYIDMPTLQALDKAPVEPGKVYFAPAGYHLSVEANRHFSLSCEEPLHFSRPAIDILMSSAADAYGAKLAGILLTGANQDGAEGMAQIHAKGGLTIVQHPEHAEIATMPLAAIKRLQPDLILSLDEITRLLTLKEPQ
jgi:two-component system, chemotaxis family, protein-glutamate methylesterase/glutaminase